MVLDGASGERFVAGGLLVLTDGDAEAAAGAVTAAGGVVTGRLDEASLLYARFDGVASLADLRAVGEGLVLHPSVAAAEPDVVVEQPTMDREPSDLEAATGQVVDFGSGQATGALDDDARWAWTRIGAVAAWEAIYEADPPLEPVLIGVVDTEVAASPVFASVPLLFRATTAIDDSSLDLSHGSTVASVIGAPADSTGVNGVMGGMECLPYDLVPVAAVGTVNDWSQGTNALVSAIVSGTVFAVRSGARVVNLSLGIPRPTYRPYFSVLFALAPDVLFVAAAGNEGVDAGDEALSGAAMEVGNVVSVAAYDRLGAPSVWGESATNHQEDTPGSITLAAPGTDVLATRFDGGVTYFEGTSAAAPLVSGVAGLVLALRPALSGAEVRNLLVQTAEDLTHEDADRISGKGLRADLAVLGALALVPDEEVGSGDCRDEPKPGDGGTTSGPASAKPCETRELAEANCYRCGTLRGSTITFDPQPIDGFLCPESYLGPNVLDYKPPGDPGYICLRGDPSDCCDAAGAGVYTTVCRSEHNPVCKCCDWYGEIFNFCSDDTGECLGEPCE